MKRLFLFFFLLLVNACSSEAVFAPPSGSMTSVLFMPNNAIVGQDGQKGLCEYGKNVSESEAVYVYGSVSRHGSAREQMMLATKRILEIIKILRRCGLAEDQIIADADPNPKRVGLQTPLFYDDEKDDRVFLQKIIR